ncbi:MAG: glycerophosphodiester phosphodiesterase [Alphaproteobacteria bacterium]|nr:glycerophosphodiester phosphodiesterase [Alphaproteobacteria bacterium]MCB9797675.1 glycerophosphodiester phosphodiesterase [Alphaproteobacteria bacterium]
MSSTLRAPLGRPRIIAHRGASAHAPENTLAAFRLAIDEGADGVECDLQLSADGEVVLIHDTELTRTTDREGPVASQPAEALAEADAGAWFHPRFAGEGVPRLAELLALPGAGLLLLELKDAGPAGFEALVTATLAAMGEAAERCVLMSFHEAALRAVVGRAPAVWLLDADAACRPGVFQDARELGVQAVGVQASGLTAARMTTAHALDLAVFAWTVNEGERARQLVEAGVDALITDAPARIRAACEA